jgi:hypothetical protein
MPVPVKFLETKEDKKKEDNREKIFDANEKIAKNFAKKKVDLKKIAYQIMGDKKFFFSCYSPKEQKIIKNDLEFSLLFRNDLASKIQFP